MHIERVYKQQETMKISSSFGICKAIYNYGRCFFYLSKRQWENFEILYE